MNDIELVGVTREIREVTLDDLITRGMELRERKDNIAWEMGDLAIVVTNKFGGRALTAFAKGTGVDASTIRRYRDVSKAYPSWFREQVKMLSWSHFRQVAAREDRQDILIRAHDETWSVEKLMAMTRKDQSKVIDDGKFVPAKPEMLFCTSCRKWYVEIEDEACKTRGQCEELYK